jgi:hypothetical protein
VIDKAELRRMSQAERRQLARFLAEFDGPDPGHPDQADPAQGHPAQGYPDPAELSLVNPYRDDPRLRRQRRLALLVSAACCVILAGWIVVLAATLPHQFDAHHWRAVWVNFDVFLLAAFAVTAWAVWRERQVLILLLVLIGTMLCCDAWFDVGTSLQTKGLGTSLASAVFAELPLAFLAFAGARRLLRATVAAGLHASVLATERTPSAAGAPAAAAPAAERDPVGTRGPARPCRSLRHSPLAGHGLDEALPLGRAHRRARQSA